jgi:dihydroorotate dehydrogenase (NAD+) catalytic subunit
MAYKLLGKKVRGRFGFGSGEIATNSDTARYLLNLIPQLGWFVGKSTTIEPTLGHPEDIITQPTNETGWNAVGYTNPGLEETVESFRELIRSAPKGVFLMPQVGESNEERFEYCAKEFDKIPVDGIELNLSCGHAKKGGILIGSDPNIVFSIVKAARKGTKKPLIVKLNAAVPKLEEIAKAAVKAGANAISAINTLPGPNPEISNQFGGLSGSQLFPVTYETVHNLRKHIKAPMIVMGGISEAEDIRRLDEIDPDFFYGIGTALAEMSSFELQAFFAQIERDLKDNTNEARFMVDGKQSLQYQPFIVKDVVELSEDLRLIRFYENIIASAGQFVFLKAGNRHAKPFSVADDEDGLELVVRKVGEATSKIFELKKNNVVRIRGPYGLSFQLPDEKTVIYVGAGCGIAPVHHAAKHHEGKRIFIVGAKTAKELVYLDELRKMGEVHFSTDDGSAGYHGLVTNLLFDYLRDNNPKNAHFFNCGPEIVMKKADLMESQYASSDEIYHLVERMTSCGIGICGKCSTPEGRRICVDGPVFTAEEFSPGKYKRDKTGKKVKI